MEELHIRVVLKMRLKEAPLGIHFVQRGSYQKAAVTFGDSLVERYELHSKLLKSMSYRGSAKGPTLGVIKGDTRNLDDGSYGSLTSGSSKFRMERRRVP